VLDKVSLLFGREERQHRAAGRIVKALEEVGRICGVHVREEVHSCIDVLAAEELLNTPKELASFFFGRRELSCGNGVT
jgi:hypothetical protein